MMNRIEKIELVNQKLERQELPDAHGTLKRVSVEVGNLLDCDVLDVEFADIFIDLKSQVDRAIKKLNYGKVHDD